MTETTTTRGPSDVEVRSKKEKEITVVNDQAFFKFDTGDTYEGYFEAKKKDRSVKRHGHGVHETAEGDIYTGIWENDKLGGNEKVTIEYNDGSKYVGQFKDWGYNGKGEYTYPDGSTLRGEFHDNTPGGRLQLTDPNGHTWLGKAEQGFGWVNPVNHYYEILESVRDTSKPKKHKVVQGTHTDTVTPITASSRTDTKN